VDGNYVVELNGDTARVVLTGEVDMVAASGVSEAILRALATKAVRVLIDLEAVTFLDACGIQAIVIGYHDAVRQGAGYGIGPAAPAVARVLVLTGLDNGLNADPRREHLEKACKPGP
jgi:anti-anti-sigma factor